MGRGSSKMGKGGGGGAKTVEIIEGKAVSTNDADDFFGSQAWQDGLTDVEKKAVGWYSGSAFRNLNEKLRGTDKDELTATQKKYQKALDKAIASAELKEPIKVYRGSTADLVKGASTIEEVKAMIGQTVTDHGFTSSSISKSGSFSNSKVLYHITVPPGKGRGAYINNLSNFSNIEYEYLLKRGGNYIIKDAAKTKGGKMVVYLQMTD